MSEEPYETHPSYGLVQISRISGGNRKLFGSPIKSSNFFSLTIKRAATRRKYHGDWYSAKEMLIQVDLSAHQLSELITTMNMGEGVPCTLKHVGSHVPIPDPPDDDVMETEKVQSEFKKQMLAVADKFSREVKEIRGILDAGGRLTVADRQKIKDALHSIEMNIRSNFPFTLTVFAEVASKIVNVSECEIDAFFSHIVHRAGLDALKQKSLRQLLGLGADRGPQDQE